jgi:hypothetical protein
MLFELNNGRTLLLRISLALACIPCLAAHAREKSLAVAYGPESQVVFAYNQGRFGAYAQPIFSYRNSTYFSDLEYGVRTGALLHYTAFTYKRMECRAQAGAGVHLATWNREYRLLSSPGVVTDVPVRKRRQWGAEIWVQPEFRFYERFAVLLDAHSLQYMREEDWSGEESDRSGFITPDLSLSELGFGLRYYFNLGNT